MKIHFLGVGEAFDEKEPNTSILIKGQLNILLDCGYSAVANFWKNYPHSSFLDAIYISHTHADHYFGLPSLLLRMSEEKRKKEVKIICQKEDVKRIADSFRLAYRGAVPDKLSFKIKFIPIDKETVLKINLTTLKFAQTSHAVPNLAIRIEEDGKSICYSGDGKFTQESARLFQKTNFLIHEGYLLKGDNPYHGNMIGVIKMATERKVKNLALVHINRQIRKKLAAIKRKLQNKDINLLFPDQGSSFTI